MDKIFSFAPVIDKNCRVLILGSMPGGESLRRQQYYGYKHNSFWKLMFELLGEPPTEDYDAKKAMLLRHNIALWDVIASCEREGSLDSAIKNSVPNDFAQLFKNYPDIRHVFFNGAKAYDTYRRFVGFDAGREYTRLPSTSPAHAIRFERKLKAWKQITSNF
jgi:TDG/mug DNA glycosylase family protein